MKTFRIYTDASVKLNSCIALVILDSEGILTTKVFPIKGNKKSNLQLELDGIVKAIEYANNLEGQIIICTDQLDVVESYNEKRENFYYKFINSYINSNKEIKLEYTSERNVYMKIADELSKTNRYKDNMIFHIIKFIKYLYNHKKCLINDYNKYGKKAVLNIIKKVWYD